MRTTADVACLLLAFIAADVNAPIIYGAARHPQRTGAERLGAVCRRADQYRIGTSPRQAPVPLTFRGDSCDLIL